MAEGDEADDRFLWSMICCFMVCYLSAHSEGTSLEAFAWVSEQSVYESMTRSETLLA